MSAKAFELANALRFEVGGACQKDDEKIAEAAAELHRLAGVHVVLLTDIRGLITKRMGAEQIREALQRAIAKAGGAA